MKLALLISIQLTVFNLLGYSQQYLYSGEFGSFKNASSFYINSTGHIYVTDSGSDEVYKLDTTGTVLKFVGGFGWDNGSFDDPADVFATSLTVYVSDKNNHRVQRFDKDLNFIELLYKRNQENSDENFGYPASAVTSGQGDLFILDTENNRILKFDLFGNFIQNFGGFEYGEYSLYSPLSMAVFSSNILSVLDGNFIIMYDLFGNGISKTQIGDGFKSIRITFNELTLNTDRSVFHSSISSKDISLKELTLSEYDNEINFVSSVLFNNKLYILTAKKILVFQK